MKRSISIIIPTYNEEGSVTILHKEIVDVMKSLNYYYEIIFVDDGSTDNTLDEIRKLEGVIAISFTRNFGKSQALQAGFDEAKGEYIVTMDGDLQDDPKEIPHFLKTIEEKQMGLICGWKKKRHDPITKRVPSKLANYITKKITKTSVHDMNCCFKIYRGDVAKRLKLYGDMHRYIPSLVTDFGFSVDEIEVDHRARQYGKTKYGAGRFFKSTFDFLTLVLLRKFSDRPMHLFGIIGMVLFGTGAVILIYLTWLKLFMGVFIGDRPLLMLGILSVLLGFQSFSVGFIGELIIRRGNSTKRDFIIKEKFFNQNKSVSGA